MEQLIKTMDIKYIGKDVINQDNKINYWFDTGAGIVGISKNTNTQELTPLDISAIYYDQLVADWVLENCSLIIETYYVRAYYPQGEMFQQYSGILPELYDQIVNDLNDPQFFKYNISTNAIDDYDHCTLDDLKKWSEYNYV